MRFRKERMAGVIQEVVSEAIAFRLNDPRIAPLSTVTRVEVSGDLMVAKVYLSIRGGDAAESKMMSAIQGAAGFLQRLVADALSIRKCPEVRFFVDQAAKDARRTLGLIEDNRRSKPDVFDGAGPTSQPTSNRLDSMEDPGGDDGNGESA